MTAMVVLVPLLLANIAFLIRDDLPATVALAGGVVRKPRLSRRTFPTVQNSRRTTCRASRRLLKH